MRQPVPALEISAGQREVLESLARSQSGAHREVVRATALLMALFAALDVLTGMVIGQCTPRHRHQEWLRFLKTIDREVPKDLAIHLIVDNYATHKHQDVRK